MFKREIITISTSFYKRYDGIERLYEAIKAQTFKEWEWVVTDDYSNDGQSEERLRALAKEDPRVKYYTQRRKRELFYNPQYGSSGAYVVQVDSDDLIYPRLLEQYWEIFTNNPSIMGITCGHIMKEELERFVSISAYPMEEAGEISFAPMARAWRNTIEHFDREGEMRWWQNDTNIMRHIEARGKVLFLPRELYNYNYSPDSISKKKYSLEEIEAIEEERLRIEGRFPYLSNGEQCTFDLKYLPIDRLTWAFYTCHFNQSATRKRVNFIKRGIRPYEKQLLRELFYDHDLVFNGDNRECYDEVVAYLDVDTYDYLVDNGSLVREFASSSCFRFFVDGKLHPIGHEELSKLGKYSYWGTGVLIFGRIII